MISEIKDNQLYFFIEVDDSKFSTQFQDNFVLTVSQSDPLTSSEYIGLLPIRKAIQNPETVFYRSLTAMKMSRFDLDTLINNGQVELVKTFEGTQYSPNSSNRLLAHVIFRALIGKKKIHTSTLKTMKEPSSFREGKRHFYYGIGKYMRTSCGMKITDDEFRDKWEYVPSTSNQIRLRNSSGELCKNCQLDEE
ncbi:MAG: hypothetical protein HeimC3_06270 [Candidatus Heimdallarchaeota archaeon LC_3]|nr:MAG: hypothetical protein HeimC3_06270 [Candidatus Heimdallarchaeota archaeon LC_3]